MKSKNEPELILALISTLRLDLYIYYIAVISEEGLFQAYCDLQSNIESNYLNKQKCSAIIDKVGDLDILKEMVLITKNFALINEALSKIDHYPTLIKISESRPELEVHVKGRMLLIPNSIRYIFD